MATKRKPAASFFADQAQTKRHRSSPPDIEEGDGGNTGPGYGATSSRLNPECGMRGAFPGLDNDGGDEDEHLFYGPASDGLEYLRMVRSEAKAVPKLLVAEPPAEAQEENGDLHRDYRTGGWYSGGAYTAAATQSDDDDDDSDGELDAQEAYYEALVKRFKKVRQTLSSAPTSTTPSTALPDGLRQTARREQWIYCFKHTQPAAKGVARASHDDVMRALYRLEAVFTKRTLANNITGSNISAWVWALLARCRDVGQMNSHQISVLRDLSKTALAVGHKLGRNDTHEEEEIEKEDGDGEEEDSSGDEADEDITSEGDTATDANGALSEDGEIEDRIEDAHAENGINGTHGTRGVGQQEEQEEGETSEADEARLEQSRQALLDRLAQPDAASNADSMGDEIEGIKELNPEEPKKRALASIDILVTLVGEVFGQRDLLDRRDVWA